MKDIPKHYSKAVLMLPIDTLYDDTYEKMIQEFFNFFEKKGLKHFLPIVVKTDRKILLNLKLLVLKDPFVKH